MTEAEQDTRREGHGAIVEVLTDQIAYLRSQLDHEGQSPAEARRIIGGLVQRVPELEAPSQETHQSRENPPRAPILPVPPPTAPATLRRARSVPGGVG